MNDASRRAAEIISEAPFGAVQRRVVGLCCVMMLLDGYDLQAMALAVPMLARELGEPPSAFGPALSASLAGIMLGTIVFGLLGDRVGRRPVVLGSFALVGAASLATSLASELTSFVLLRFLTGLGIGGVLPNAMALISEFTPRRSRALWITIAGCAVSAGGFAASLLAATFMPVAGWEVVFIVGGAVPILIAIGAWWHLPESVVLVLRRDPGEPRALATLATVAPGSRLDAPLPTSTAQPPVHRPASIGDALWGDGRAPGTVLLWFLFVGGLLIIYLLISWLPTLVSRSGASLEGALLATSMYQLGGVVGGLVLGVLIGRVGATRPLACAYVLAAVSMLALANTSSLGLVFPLVALLGATSFGAQVALNVLAAEHYPTAVRSTGFGWAQSVGRIGAIAGPLLGASALAAAWTPHQVFTWLAGCALLGAVLAAVSRHGLSRSSQPVPRLASDARRAVGNTGGGEMH